MPNTAGPTRSALVSRAALAALAATVAGCGHGGSGGFGGTASAPAGNVYRQAMRTEPTTFDPDLVQDTYTTQLLQQVYEGLVQWTPKNTLAPCLATDWSVTGGGTIYTFHLRPGVAFQSGAPLTAAAVAYSLQRSLDPKLASPVGLTYMSDIAGAQAYASGKAATVSGIKVTGPLTVQVTITKPKAYWIDVLSYPTAYVVNPAAVAKDAGGKLTAANADGTGAFSVKQYSQGGAVDLAANPRYWGGAPPLAGQHWPILTDANTRHSEYLAGQLDEVDESQGAQSADKANPQLAQQLKLWPRAQTIYIAFGENAAPVFKDPRVRQAFAYATDKSRLVQVVFDNQRDVAQDFLSEGMPGWNASLRGLTYDPVKARQLLAAAGYPGGKGFPPLQIVYSSPDPAIPKVVDLLRGMYTQTLGIPVTSRPTEWATLLQQEDRQALVCWVNGWSADYLDPQDYYSLLLRTSAQQNHTGYSNAAFDKLCDAADIDQNPARRMAEYHQAGAIAAQEVPLIPLYYDKAPELQKPYVRGLQDCLMSHLPYKKLSLGDKRG